MLKAGMVSVGETDVNWYVAQLVRKRALKKGGMRVKLNPANSEIGGLQNPQLRRKHNATGISD